VDVMGWKMKKVLGEMEGILCLYEGKIIEKYKIADLNFKKYFFLIFYSKNVKF
jgi:hypothetical protein